MRPGERERERLLGGGATDLHDPAAGVSSPHLIDCIVHAAG